MAILVIFWIAFLPFQRTHLLLYALTCGYVSVVVICKMFMQLHLVQLPSFLNVTCYRNTYVSACDQRVWGSTYADISVCSVAVAL